MAGRSKKNKSYLLGVDLGTTGTKAAIFDNNGKLIAKAYEETKLYYPKPGWVEQDPEDFYISAVHTIQQCLKESGIPVNQLEAVAFDGQMAGIGTIDSNWGTPTVYDSWLDTRCKDYINQMKVHEKMIINKSGGPPTYCHGPKILWWMNKAPDIWRKIHKFVVPGSYVAGRMAGLKGDDAFIDYTYLHFSSFSNTKTGEWDEDLCNIFKVPIKKLPRIVKPWEIIGHLSPEAAEHTGLLEGTPIAAGAGDQAAGMLGAGMVKPGMVLDVAGTASVFSICVDRFVPDLKYKTLFTVRLVPENLYCALAYINGGGLNLRWFRDELAKNERDEAKQVGKDLYTLMNEKAALVPAGSERLIFIPHLGGRVCPNNPDIRGQWIGFTWAHRKEHFYRSMLEAVAYEYAIYLGIEKELISNLNFTEVRVIGGGAVSKLWNQIKADVLGIPYVSLNRQEYAVLGSAIIAGYAVGLFENMVETAKSFIQPTDKIESRKKHHLYYQKLVKQYINLLNCLCDTYIDLAALPEPPY